jgi:hypothetical protein
MSEREEDLGREERTDPAAVDESARPAATAEHDEPMAQSNQGADLGERDAESREVQPSDGGGGGIQSMPSAGSTEDERAPLLAQDETERFRRRWEELQAGFVDRPREMVEEADDLVGQLMQQLTTGFGEERSSLEAQWEKGEDVSTEDLRVALTRYRSFFNRLLSA